LVILPLLNAYYDGLKTGRRRFDFCLLKIIIKKPFPAGLDSAIYWTTLFFDYRPGRAGRGADIPGIQRVSEYL
jgi:hypothetical protein